MRALFVCLAIVFAAACASLSGYDASRYETAPAAPSSVDPETRPLPAASRQRMLDPRNPLPDAGR
jgi:hypothetical protein